MHEYSMYTVPIQATISHEVDESLRQDDVFAYLFVAEYNVFGERES
jgi:hypothetical protein